ncbi:Dephospho-CoA kinase [Thermodesulfobium narugense DSM 14796]|uniref:Dephospho-CoA kinase n=1 Tax=Thermodesulfobium narugense DSM 14796 TaxID=747365 RepID=M1E6P4_9BACT|nr:dephospho-CoA kinase [Thermodesulfobium narugense]AEE14901.1 Dephospho-CoA kinase [Thermodesulfobium narugense DSM 14796]
MKKEGLLIAITGPQGSGKSEVLNFLSRLGFEVYSADEISKKIFNENFQDIYNMFKSYFDGRQNYDIQKLRREIALIISKDKFMKKKLEDLIWPKIKEYFKSILRRDKIVFVEIPLLFEANMEDDFDIIWIVDAPFDVRLNRLVKSREYSEEEAKVRMNMQWPPSKPIEKCKVPIYYIDGSQDIEDVKKRVLDLLNSL